MDSGDSRNGRALEQILLHRRHLPLQKVTTHPTRIHPIRTGTADVLAALEITAREL